MNTFDIKYRKIGDENCPKLGSKDPTVSKFADKENLVILTNNDKLKKQCELSGVNYVFNDLTDFARKIKGYYDSN